MDYNEQLCNEHKIPIQFICTHHHDCPDRRLCGECLHQSHSDIDKMYQLPIRTFKDQILEKLRIKNIDQLPQFQGVFKRFQKQVMEILNNLELLLQNIQEEFLEMDSDFTLIQQQLQQDNNQFLFKFNKKQLNFTVSLLINNLKEEQKLHFETIQYKTFQSLTDQCDKVLSQLNVLNDYKEKKVIENLEHNISIEGQTFLGLNHGDFNYIIDGQRIYAGKYLFGQKQGIWQEFTSKKERKIAFFEYQYGKQLKQLCCFGEMQNQVKHGWWLENNNGITNFTSGFYKNGKRVGIWQSLLNSQIQGTGLYDEQGQKQGPWTEIDQKFAQFYNILKGEYKNGIKFGNWIVTNQNSLKIGEGVFDSNNLKTGLWTEQDIILPSLSYLGCYMASKRIGKWVTIENKITIGGGQYDNNGVKFGTWVEFEGSLKQIFKYSGQYYQGKRIDNWTIQNNELITMYLTRVFSGGGSYDKQGLKDGQWIEVDKVKSAKSVGKYVHGVRYGQWTFYQGDAVVAVGEFANNQKSGIWTEVDPAVQISFRGECKEWKKLGQWDYIQNEQVIGGGYFDEQGVKQGQWIEFNKNYQKKYQGLYEGGKRVGQWTIIIADGQLIAQGNYDKNNLETGSWVFIENSKIRITGQYQAGKRVEQWEIYEDLFLIAKGFYDEQETKTGKWIEFDKVEETMSKGEYKGSKKIGKWNIFKHDKKVECQTYDDQGNLVNQEKFGEQ